MAKLLVTMTGHDPIEKLMPCFEMLAKPGMTVIFVFPSRSIHGLIFEIIELPSNLQSTRRRWVER